MGRYKKDFVLYARPLQDGRSVWYYRTYTEDGRRTPGCSTGLTSKTLAEKHCNKLKAQGKLIPEKVIARAYMPTLREWAESEHWWQWGECRYLRGQLSRSDTEKPAVSRRYADDALRDLSSYILPALGFRRLDEIGPKDCEDLMFKWQGEGYAMKTINNRASVLRIMLGEAERLGKIERNPWSRVESFKPASHPKGILTLEEARALLNPERVSVVWAGNELTYLTSLLASVTACRLGEVLGLRREDLFPDHIHVASSWKRKYGLGRTKTKRIDDIPVPRFVAAALTRFCEWEGYVFSYCRGDKPAEPSRVNDALKAALERIGITAEERLRRRISYHSWRAFANTYMRARGISGEKVRQLTRHDSEAMTEHYSQFRLEDFKDIAEAQETLVAGFRRKKAPVRTEPGSKARARTAKRRKTT